MSAKYKSPSFLLPNELNTSANPANDTGVNSLYSMNFVANRYIDTGDAFTSLTSFSISVWFKSDNTAAAAQAIVSSRINSIATSQGLDLNISVNAIYARVFNNGATQVTTSFTDTTSWHHIVMTYNGTTLEMYLDGVSQGTATGVYTNSAANWLIGKWNAGSNYFDGKIDEVAIFNRALTDGTGGTVNEIAALYDGSGSNIRPSNLMATDLNPLAYYPLGEQAQMQGYLGNEASSEWQFPNGVLQDYVMDFDGTDNVNSEANISSVSSFTASIWINRDDSATQYIYGQWVDGTTASQSWVVQTVGGIVYFNVRDASLSVKSAISTTSLTTGIWYNIIAVWTGSNIKLYINNSLEDTTACSSMNNPSTAVKLAIGSSSNNVSPFNGKISNVVIWNSDQESNRDNIYNNGSPQTNYTVTPQNWWKLNADSVYTPSSPNYTTALDFDGQSTTNVVVSNSTSQVNALSMWFKPDSTITNSSGMEHLISFNSSIYTPGGIKVGLPSHILGVQPVTTGTGTSTGSFYNQNNISADWHHLVINWDGTKYAIYLDNQSLTISLTGNQSLLTLTDGLVIGNRTNLTNPFNGEISNVAIFNSSLTDSQISTLFNFGTPETNISFSPTAWWKLDNTTTGIQDSSGNGNNGTNNGATQVSSSVAVVPSWKIPSVLPITSTPNYTTALEFNYKDSIAFGNSIGNLIGDNYTGGLSFSFWLNPSTTNSDDGVFNFANNRISFVVRANKFILYSSSCTNGQCFSYNYTNPNNEWAHCVISFLPSGSSFYLNGKSVANWTYTDLNINGKDFHIGWYASINYYYVGKLSNFQIWDTNLSETDAQTLYNAGTPIANLSGIPQNSNLISWWKLNDAGSTIIDSAGNNNGSYNSNSATLVASDVLTPQPSNGVSTTLPSTALQQSNLQFDSPYSNYSLSFDGAGDYISASASNLPTSDYTFSAWVKISSFGNYGILGYGDYSSVRGSNAFRFSSTELKNYWYGDDFNHTVKNNQDPDIYGILNNWTHVVVTYDSSIGTYGQRVMYLNGNQIATNNPTGAAAFNLQNFTIGRTRHPSSPEDFNGKIDETSIFNYALSPAQVLEIYNNGKPNDLSALSGTAPISWWRLGENAYFDNNSFVVPNSIPGAPNGTGAGTTTTMISADAPGTYANGIGENLDILDRVGDAPLSTSNSQSYNMIPDDKVPYVPGYVGLQTNNIYSMSFDAASNTSFNGGNDASLQITGNLTVSMWFKTTATSGYLISDTPAIGGCYSILMGGGNGQLWVRRGNGTNAETTQKTSNTYNDGNWHNITFVSDSTMRIYVDGVLDVQSTVNTPSSIGGFQVLKIGDGFSNFTGEIDEVAIFDTALNAGQIFNDLYQPTATATNKTADLVNNPNLPNPVAWYRMGD